MSARAARSRRARAPSCLVRLYSDSSGCTSSVRSVLLAAWTKAGGLGRSRTAASTVAGTAALTVARVCGSTVAVASPVPSRLTTASEGSERTSAPRACEVEGVEPDVGLGGAGDGGDVPAALAQAGREPPADEARAAEEQDPHQPARPIVASRTFLMPLGSGVRSDAGVVGTSRRSVTWCRALGSVPRASGTRRCATFCTVAITSATVVACPLARIASRGVAGLLVDRAR